MLSPHCYFRCYHRKKWLDLCIYLRFFLTTFLINWFGEGLSETKLNRTHIRFFFAVFSAVCTVCMSCFFLILSFLFLPFISVCPFCLILYSPRIRIVSYHICLLLNKTKKKSFHIPYSKWYTHLRFAVSLSLSLMLLFYILVFICVNKGKLSPVCKLFRNDTLYSYKIYVYTYVYLYIYICIYTYIRNVIVFIDRMNQRTWWEMWMKRSIPTMMMNWVYREVCYSFFLQKCNNNNNNANHV